MTSKMLGSRVSFLTRERVLATAKQELMQNTSTIKQIAANLHFSDTAHFDSFFKVHTGLMPTEFKTKSNV